MERKNGRVWIKLIDFSGVYDKEIIDIITKEDNHEGFTSQDVS